LSVHWTTRHKEQLFQRLLAEQSNSTSRDFLNHSPRPLSVGGSTLWATVSSGSPSDLPSNNSLSSDTPRDSPRALSVHWAARYREYIFQRLLAEKKLSAVTLPETRSELCPFTGRLDIGSKSSSDYLPSDSLDHLYQQRLSKQLSKSLGTGSST
jgi:hypothetical protein